MTASLISAWRGLLLSLNLREKEKCCGLLKVWIFLFFFLFFLILKNEGNIFLYENLAHHALLLVLNGDIAVYGPKNSMFASTALCRDRVALRMTQGKKLVKTHPMILPKFLRRGKSTC